MTNFWVLSIPIILTTLLTVDSARILSVIPVQGTTHYKTYEPLLKKLAERGHEVVSVSYFPQETKLPNFKDVDVRSAIPKLMDGLSVEEFGRISATRNLLYIINSIGIISCERILSHPGVQNLITKNERFDLLIVQIFATDCFLGLAHKLNISRTVGVIASVALPWSNEIVGNPENPAYVPNWFSSFTEDMNIYERLENTVILLATKLVYKVQSDRESLKIARRYLGNDLPDFDELRSRISLILTNGHVAVSAPRPLTPGMKELGGMHIPSSAPPTLETDLQDYLDSQNQDGVVYFSFGSFINTASMPQETVNIFYRAFAELPQKVLWKCDGKKMPPLPKNVRCMNWMPQLSVLCHPNVRLLISHGGILSVQEAVYCGVPILGLPLFADQHLNLEYFARKGLAIKLNYRKLSYELLSSSLKELLTNKSYTRMAQEASILFKDRPIPPLEEAVYWVEYILRHGPDVLKSAASKLSWYQYTLLDIILLIIMFLIFVTWFMYKAFNRLFFNKRKIGSDQSDKSYKKGN